jgi:hypothetical protein
VSIDISCAACKKSYRVKDELAGKTAKCSCGEKIAIPLPQATIDLDEVFAEMPKSTDDLFAPVTAQNGQTLASLPVAAPKRAARQSSANAKDLLQGTAAKIGQILLGAVVVGFVTFRAIRRENFELSTKLTIAVGGAAVGAVVGLLLTFRDVLRKGRES